MTSPPNTGIDVCDKSSVVSYRQCSDREGLAWTAEVAPGSGCGVSVHVDVDKIHRADHLGPVARSIALFSLVDFQNRVSSPSASDILAARGGKCPIHHKMEQARSGCEYVSSPNISIRQWALTCRKY
jgi:hypothetical protein